MFTVTNDVDGTYDAYENDIAIASFFFEEPVAYEYTRWVTLCIFTIILISSLTYFLLSIKGGKDVNDRLPVSGNN